MAVTDVKGAYLNAKMKDQVIMKIIGPKVDLFLVDEVITNSEKCPQQEGTIIIFWE